MNPILRGAFLVLSLFFAWPALAGTSPGFRVETVAENIPGFVSSLVADSTGTIYCTTTNGWIHRVGADGSVTPVALLPTRSGGNGGLLGMALLDDATAVVHYTVWIGERKVRDDVIATVDLQTGAASTLHSFVCDIDNPDDGVSDEHHGGNPTVAPDGSIFVGIGDFAGRTLAQKPEWNGGKIWRIDRQGNATQWALGLRNPFDLAFDPGLDAVVLADNGPIGGDEINVVRPGANLGWPVTVGSAPSPAGMTPPVYVFPQTVAPTGFARLRGGNHLLRSGYVMGAFVTKGLYYFPAITEPATNPPHVLVEDFGRWIIDVTEGPEGELLFASSNGGSTAIHRLVPPARGDCNGDAALDWRDVVAIVREIGDGGGHSALSAPEGDHLGTWGCDANSDGVIDALDVETVTAMLKRRRRGVR